MENIFSGKTVLIAGGTGSFGRAFTEYLVNNSQAKKIIVFSRDELKQFYMEKEMPDPRLRFFLGDIRDSARLERAFHGVDIVVHAAALKQVPSTEYNPLEAVKTNIIGTQNIIDAAINQGVSKALLISTDKAAYPANLYGSTKLCAEKLFIAGNSYSGGTAKFSVVRYGNVLGSRGSIVEMLINTKDCGTVKITDERMTRFWIHYEQALELVRFALTEMEGGEIFVPKLPSMKLVDLFDALAPNAQREIMGLRPGEKIHEVLLTENEARNAWEIENYYVILPEFKYWGADAYDKYYKQGKNVEENFCFSSHANSLWLTKDQLKEIIKKYWNI